MFIKVRLLDEDGTIVKAFLNTDEIESIKEIDGIVYIYYKGKDEEGTNWLNKLDNTFDEINNKLTDANLVAKWNGKSLN
jgi:hypothetical protein